MATRWLGEVAQNAFKKTIDSAPAYKILNDIVWTL